MSSKKAEPVPLHGNHGQSLPSSWVLRWAHLVRPSGTVLDVACGYGRHARFFARLNHAVEAVDRDRVAVDSLKGLKNIQALAADIENGPWPYGPREFAAIVVTNYLHRPLFPLLIEALEKGGILIYETFAAGNEQYGRPKNPDFLLRPGELLDTVQGKLRVISFEEGLVHRPHPAVIQRICAARVEQA